MLVYQNKKQIQLDSFLYGPVQTIDSICKNIPFIVKMEDNGQTSDQIFFLSDQGLSVQIKRIWFSGKEAKDTIYDCYSLKTVSPRFFRYYKKRFFILFDNFTMVRFDLDSGTNKMENQKLFVFNDNDVEDQLKMQMVNYDLDRMMAVSDYSFYWKQYVYNLNEHSKIKKDKNFLSNEELLKPKDENNAVFIFQGPQRIKNPNFLVYVAKNAMVAANSVELDSEEQEKDEVINQEEEGPNQNEELKEKERIIVVDGSTTKAPDQISNAVKEDTRGFSVSKTDIKTERDVGLYYQEQKMELFQGTSDEIDSALQVYLVIPIDQSFSQFVHNDTFKIKKPEDRLKIYEQNIVTFSTFIQDRNRVLIIIQGIPMVFTKFGLFICQVEIYDEKGEQQDQLYLKQQSIEEVAYVSDSCRYFLFSSINIVGPKTFHIFELKMNGKQFTLSRTREPFTPVHSKVNYKNNFNSVKVDNSGVVTSFQVIKASADQLYEEAKHQQMSPHMKDDEFSSPLNQEAQPCFRLFQFDKDVTDDIQSSLNQFKTLSGYLSAGKPNFDSFGAVILGEYLIIKYEKKVEYMKIFAKDKSANDAKPTELDLMLNPNCEYTMIYSTGSETLIQLIIKNQPDYLLHVIVWDLLKNMEYSQTQIDIDYDEMKPEYRVVKGENAKFNYFCCHSFFIDFQFYFPVKFLKAHQSDSVLYEDLIVNQRNVSFDCQQFLDLMNKNTITYSHTMQNLIYFKQFEQLDKYERDSSKIVLLHYRARINTQTLFHMFFDDLKLLQLLLEEVQNADDDEVDVNANRESLLNILYPNKKGKSAFDNCLKRKSPKLTELYLKMLIELDFIKHYRFSKFIRKHFDVLFDMEVDVFFKYLEMCTFRLQDMQKTLKLAWPYEDQEVYLQNHTSYLGEDFMSRLQQKSYSTEPQPKGNKVEEEKKQEPEEKEPEKPDIMLKYDRTEQNPNHQNAGTKKVEIMAIEFDWIFSGPLSQSFMQKLAEFEDARIFDVETVKILILYQWSKFFPIIFRRLFLPFLLYFFLYNIYVTGVYQYYTFNPKKAAGLDLAFEIIIIIFLAGFSVIEFRQVFIDPIDYFSSFWNWIDILSILLNSAFVIGDFVGIDPKQQRMIGAASVLIFWLKFYYFLRLFKATSAFLKMMSQIMSDIKAFGLFLLLAFIAFQNTYYVMAYQGYDPEQGGGSLFTGSNFLQAFIYSYLSGLGAFDYDPFDNLKYGEYLWLIWFFQVIFIMLVLLNLLVALLTSSFQGVAAEGDRVYLKGICNLINDNEFILNREKVFSKAKYIIIARLEKGEREERDIETILWDLRMQFKQIIQNSAEETKQINTDLNQELMEEIKECKQKITQAVEGMQKEIQAVYK